MDSSNQQSMNRQNDPLGVNRIGKSITKNKSPLHQTSFVNNPRQQQPQPHVYNINKNDFRNIVQQLTGSPSREPPQPRPPQNNPKPPNHRLHRVRPPPLAPSRPRAPLHPNSPIPQPGLMPPTTPGDVWANTTVSPVSAYMQYLQNSVIGSGPPQPHLVPPPLASTQPPAPAHPHSAQHYRPSPPALLPPTPSDVWSSRTESPTSAYMRYLQTSIIGSGPPAHTLPSPHSNVPTPFVASPRVNGQPHSGPPPHLPPAPQLSGGRGPPLASPRANSKPPLLPSPTSQFLLPSPNGFSNLFSPRSPYPLLSPGYMQPPPISPNFSFGSAGILGPGPHPPLSPGYGFPLSPSGFFPISSPRWRDQ